MTDTDTSPVAPVAFDRRMLEILVCPASQGTLDYDADRQELISASAGVAYPIRDGIPVMLMDEARRLED
ncbi:UPF0434 protein [Salipiger pallidus]|uniref:UPF0434 protein GCM10011415_12280 n=1 Tax=Salipiger pallidus TaxID=1775170 RepID=A0A8J3EFU7_9RHOB|nr:Trm112 family protein [Salipiger pallidus]GGG66935.1 UPF0434 protein [Salipiger pallidus]